MHRLRKVALAALVALTFTACDEGTPPPVDVPPPPTPVGTISGTVTIDGTGATGITATLSSGATTATGAGGTFSFAGVEAGSYTVTISGYPTDAAFPSATQSATIASDGQTVQLNFTGEYIRSSSVVGEVIAADPMMMGTDSNGDILRPDKLDGITVTLEGEHAMAEPQHTMEGGFAFTGLRAGSYTVTISGYPDDVQFDTPSMTIEVEVGDVGMANFEGAYIRTAAVEGQVAIDDEGLPGVTVTLTGGRGNDNYTKLTGDNGEYAFTELRPGDYQISISGYDPDDYEFASSSHDISVELDETETVSFTGVLLRTSGISGRVSVEGDGIGDVTVNLAGASEATTTTDASGQYAFSGLSAGTFVVTIANPDDVAYVFDDTEATVTLAEDASEIQNFEGAHARTSSISGVLFLDSNPSNDTYDIGSEDRLPHAGFPVALQGPGVGEVRTALTDATGAYVFAELRAGTYRVVALITAEVSAALDIAGFAFGGELTGVVSNVAANGKDEVNIPINIVRQTIGFAAVMGNGQSGDDATLGGPVEGVKVNVYADLNDVAPIGSGETDATGVAAVMFKRGGDGDNVVFARVDAESLPSESFALTGDETMTVAYGGRSPAAQAGAPFTMLNRAASIQFWVKNIETGRGGGQFINGWDAEYTMSGAEEDADPTEIGASGLDEDGDETETGRVGPFDVMPEVGDLPVTYTVMLAEEQDSAMDQEFSGMPVVPDETFVGMVDEDGKYLTFTHTGLEQSGDVADLGAYIMSFATQDLVVGVHWERNHREGFTEDALAADMRPTAGDDGLHADVDVTLLLRNSRGLWDPVVADDLGLDCEDDEDDMEHAFCESEDAHTKAPGSSGLVTFNNLPADMEFAVEFNTGSSQEEASEDDALSFANFSDNDVGAFGAEGGAYPEVRLCPLSESDEREDCSTFAYVWGGNSVTLHVGSADYGADNDGTPDLNADELSITLVSTSDVLRFKTSETTPDPQELEGGTAGQVTFTNVPEGPYRIEVGRSDEWAGPSKARTIPATELARDADNEDVVTEYGTAADPEIFVVRYKQTSISGVVANDFVADDNAASNEAASGITVELRAASRGRPGAVVASDRTNGDGEYEFDDVVEGTYFVQAKGSNHDLHADVKYSRSGRTTHHLTQAITTIAVPDDATNLRAYIAGTTGATLDNDGEATNPTVVLPHWDYATSMVAGYDGDQRRGNFVILFKDARVSGLVERDDDGDVEDGGRDDNGDDDPMPNTTVELNRCTMSNYDAQTGLATTCTQYGDRLSATTGSDGTWHVDGLTEGVWEISVRMPTSGTWNYDSGDEGNRVEVLRGEGHQEQDIEFLLDGPPAS